MSRSSVLDLKRSEKSLLYSDKQPDRARRYLAIKPTDLFGFVHG